VHGVGEDDPLVMFVGSGTTSTDRRHLFSDTQGSIVSIADASGNPAGINSYDDWGSPPLAPNPANSGRFQYTGQAWISQLGMYYYKALFLWSPHPILRCRREGLTSDRLLRSLFATRTP
jgi:hypothetical protein